ncbi:MAG TPA: SRPBCC domain-containing protein, partial [Rhizobiaceae bacterium]|nr:SRPBCC domain-containing protein [Rhizobiaceae bacterium]
MKTVEVRRMIAADTARIWAVLSDPAKLASGRLGVTRIEGRIGAGERFKLWSEASPGRAFPLKVTAYEPGRRMVWEGGMPLGLFHGKREFVLTPGPGATDFHMREQFTGLLSGPITRSMPDMQPFFDRF